MRERKIDPMTFAVLAKRLDMIGAAMRDTGLLSAYSPILNLARDFSTGIFDSQSQLVELEAALPAHICGTDFAVRNVAEFFGGDIHPGDLFLHNDPFGGGAHIDDLNFCCPVFVEGEHIFWAVTRGHQLDVGNSLPCDTSGLLTDIYMEGMHIPPLRIERNWEPIKDVVNMYFNNIRYRDVTEGDFWAMVSSVRVGEKRLIELCKEYGMGLIKQFVQEYFDYADERMAAEVRAIPDGMAYAEVEADPDQFGNQIVVRCKLTIKDDMIIADLTESSDQVPGVNSTDSMSHAAVCLSIAYCVDPTIPKNAGMLKHIKSIRRRGSVMNPIPPVGTSVGTTYVPDPLIEAVLRCMMQLAPEKATAGWGQIGLMMTVSGVDKRRGRPRPYSAMAGGAVFGGGGAVKGYDGWPLMASGLAGGGLLKQSIEGGEYQMPILVLQQGIWTDGAGDGQWRGGVGTQSITQHLGDEMVVVPTYGGAHKPGQPFGGAGGTGSAPNYEARIDLSTGEEVPFPPWTTVTVTKGEAHIMKRSGGGGWGDPLDRDPELVRKDARNGIISLAKASDVYGVVLDTETETFEVDYEATARRREALKNSNSR